MDSVHTELPTKHLAMLAGAFKGAARDIEAKQNQRKLVGKLHNTICVPGSEPGDPDVCNWPAVNCAFGDPADKRKITGAEITCALPNRGVRCPNLKGIPTQGFLDLPRIDSNLRHQLVEAFGGSVTIVFQFVLSRSGWDPERPSTPEHGTNIPWGNYHTEELRWRMRLEYMGYMTRAENGRVICSTHVPPSTVMRPAPQHGPYAPILWQALDQQNLFVLKQPHVEDLRNRFFENFFRCNKIYFKRITGPNYKSKYNFEAEIEGGRTLGNFCFSTSATMPIPDPRMGKTLRGMKIYVAVEACQSALVSEMQVEVKTALF